MVETIQKTDIDKLEFVCERLAYVCFLEDREGHLARANVTHENIKSFDIKVYVSEYLDDNGEPVSEMTIRFTVNLLDGNQHIAFQYYHPQFVPAMLEQLVVSNGAWQQYTFHYGKPNSIVLFDAEYLLEEELGVLAE